ncbi:hypothetical protein C7Y66_01595 [Chroococcidiopsis sp. CCALA 051]|uniref:hypothetical protein n=1 Tax=Chroococcidiopsis sp. CCALA 051 TaxID=869949 RepID=UPI000D0E3004|nr:hypothetical protein [Chroococcidiopsis sp. CCALA 051]MBE9017582.1 hypothetical protein [Chroococcidiopsidales cyanobacterium LEGE 13417]PSM50896.1 hypothetical protein C7Y66_01595 [Chroococcidiopsis sp. CCALA 051]
MKTLTTLFNESRSDLHSEIERATSLEQVVKVVQNRLDELERSYVGELSIAQVRLASFFLEVLRQSLNTLSAIDYTQASSTEQGQIVSRTSKLSPKNLILKLLQGLSCIGILGALFSSYSNSSQVWIAILLLFLLVGLEVVFQLNASQENRLDSAVLKEFLPSKVQVDKSAILNSLGDALNTIDLAVAASENNKTIDASGIEELPELLNFLQRLSGASFLDRPQMTLELVKLLPQILIEQGIRIQMYRSQDESSRREYFDFEPNIDRSAQEYITITPALWKGDRLLLRGRVIEPARSMTENENIVSS